MAQHTISCPCIEDAGLDYTNPNTNYGSAVSYDINDGDVGTDRPQRTALLKFNIPSTARNKRIISATLCIYINSVGGYGSPYFSAYSFNLNWNEGTITYNTSLLMSNRVLIHTLWVPSTTMVSGAWTNAVLLPSVVQQEFEKIFSNGVEIVVPPNQANYYEYANLASRESISHVPHLDIIYEDVPPDAPIPTEPIGLYKDSSSIISFAWQYNSPVGGSQSKFDLQWSADQATWTTITQVTANTYYDMAAGTFPTGNIYWRVRCYNAYNEVGAYCTTQAFYAIGAPDAPSINVIPTNSARPIITWSAFNQQIFQLQILAGAEIMYDSGDQPSISGRSYKITAFLADDSYTAKMRIKNEYSLWSAWSECSFTLSTVKPGKPTLVADTALYGIDFTVGNLSSGNTVLLYRDSVCIAQSGTSELFDYASENNKEHEYFVRTITHDETFNDSDSVTAIASFKYSLLAPISDISNVFAITRSLNTPPKRNYERNQNNIGVLYSGRTYPVNEPSEHINAGISLVFYIKTHALLDAFITLCDYKDTVLYRDIRGRKIFGTIGGLSVNDEWPEGYTVSCAVTQVDYIEELEV